MLLHWSPFSDEPVRLTQETLKAMTSEQMQASWPLTRQENSHTIPSQPGG